MKTILSFTVTLALAAIFGSGCATLYPEVKGSYLGPGNSGSGGEQGVSEAAEEMEVVDGVTIYSDEVPAGLLLEDGGATLVVAPGHESEFEILGTAEANYLREGNTVLFRNLFWTWDFKETWRKWYCYPQVPLKILSLGIYTLFSPWGYPCQAAAPVDKSEREETLREYMMKAAKAMGGNVVIFSDYETLAVTTVDGERRQTMKPRTGLVFKKKGFVVLKKND